MSKVLSLSKNEDFKTVLGGKKILNKFVTIYYKKLTINDKNKFIYSIIAKKKLGNAVFRNKIKRRLKSIALEAYKKININLVSLIFFTVIHEICSRRQVPFSPWGDNLYL